MEMDLTNSKAVERELVILSALFPVERVLRVHEKLVDLERLPERRRRPQAHKARLAGHGLAPGKHLRAVLLAVRAKGERERKGENG